jgi:predicted enzyme related to lactoylglutathione lyase
MRPGRRRGATRCRTAPYVRILDDAAHALPARESWSGAAARREHAAMRHVLTILAVADLTRAARFYETVFGWRRSVDVPVYVQFATPDGPGLGVYARQNFARNTRRDAAPSVAGTTTATELYFLVEDVGAAVARALAAGAELLSPAAVRDWGDEVAYVADPDGNVLAFARAGHEEGGSA